jgi:hypothetical protein
MCACDVDKYTDLLEGGLQLFEPLWEVVGCYFGTDVASLDTG